MEHDDGLSKAIEGIKMSARSRLRLLLIAFGVIILFLMVYILAFKDGTVVSRVFDLGLGEAQRPDRISAEINALAKDTQDSKIASKEWIDRTVATHAKEFGLVYSEQVKSQEALEAVDKALEKITAATKAVQSGKIEEILKNPHSSGANSSAVYVYIQLSGMPSFTSDGYVNVASTIMQVASYSIDDANTLVSLGWKKNQNGVYTNERVSEDTFAAFISAAKASFQSQGNVSELERNRSINEKRIRENKTRIALADDRLTRDLETLYNMHFDKILYKSRAIVEDMERYEADEGDSGRYSRLMRIIAGTSIVVILTTAAIALLYLMQADIQIMVRIDVLDYLTRCMSLGIGGTHDALSALDRILSRIRYVTPGKTVLDMFNRNKQGAPPAGSAKDEIGDGDNGEDVDSKKKSKP